MDNSSGADVSELEKYRTLSVFVKIVGELKGAPLVDEAAIDALAEGYFVRPSDGESWRTCLFVTGVLEMTLEDPENADVYVRGIKRVLGRRMDERCFPYRAVDAYVARLRGLDD